MSPNAPDALALLSDLDMLRCERTRLAREVAALRAANLDCEAHFEQMRAERDQAQAALAEAGTVANETGLTPRQLADQRAELMEVLRLSAEAIESAIKCVGPSLAIVLGDRAMVARAALARCKGEV